MKSLSELRSFCEGFYAAINTDDTDDLAGTDSWIVWGGYDINLAGYDHSGHAKHRTNLHVDAYKAGWTTSLGDPVHSFTI